MDAYHTKHSRFNGLTTNLALTTMKFDWSYKLNLNYAIKYKSITQVLQDACLVIKSERNILYWLIKIFLRATIWIRNISYIEIIELPSYTSLIWFLWQKNDKCNEKS